MEGKVYSIREAAEKLKVTEKTIRNRIKRGDLPARKVPRPGGFAWRVELPEEPEPGVREVVELPSPTVQALLGVLREKDEEIGRLQDERAQLMARVGMFQERSENLQKLLEAPPRPPPWWRRLLRR